MKNYSQTLLYYNRHITAVCRQDREDPNADRNMNSKYSFTAQNGKRNTKRYWEHNWEHWEMHPTMREMLT